ncbi:MULTISPECIES: type II toxin-antitoxin system PemK/MazF family toxin [unclassified Adlercreutzia]|uniref:type II toxin-antitoxin system PemK/MazF family toxin n=1 Tax=unclassified Adlercreutzia TaxID=2636013 RepID=UPI0013ED7C13|nr:MULTISPECIES: type II toxin-antitoxin system PemK/MazF family toxin [unclassified Adlercreutzia]
MPSLSVSLAPWQVWLAYVRFADHPEVGKVRPVVIIDSDTVAVIAAKVTSASPKSQYQYYELLDWQEGGLLKPSRVQLAPLISLNPDDLLNGEPLGYLSERDRSAFAILLESSSA